jgi:hypothetical protein
MATKRKKAKAKRVRDLPESRLSNKRAKDVKGGIPVGPPIRKIPPGPPI